MNVNIHSKNIKVNKRKSVKILQLKEKILKRKFYMLRNKFFKKNHKMMKKMKYQNTE